MTASVTGLIAIVLVVIIVVRVLSRDGLEDDRSAVDAADAPVSTEIPRREMKPDSWYEIRWAMFTARDYFGEDGHKFHDTLVLADVLDAVQKLADHVDEGRALRLGERDFLAIKGGLETQISVWERIIRSYESRGGVSDTHLTAEHRKLSAVLEEFLEYCANVVDFSSAQSWSAPSLVFNLQPGDTLTLDDAVLGGQEYLDLGPAMGTPVFGHDQLQLVVELLREFEINPEPFPVEIGVNGTLAAISVLRRRAVSMTEASMAKAMPLPVEESAKRTIHRRSVADKAMDLSRRLERAYREWKLTRTDLV